MNSKINATSAASSLISQIRVLTDQKQEKKANPFYLTNSILGAIKEKDEKDFSPAFFACMEKAKSVLVKSQGLFESLLKARVSFSGKDGRILADGISDKPEDYDAAGIILELEEYFQDCQDRQYGQDVAIISPSGESLGVSLANLLSPIDYMITACQSVYLNLYITQKEEFDYAEA